MSVLRSTDCWTDHKLLHGQLKIKVSMRFAVSGLKDVKIREKYMEKVSELVEVSWDEVSSGAEIREGLVGAAEDTLGWETRKQPDWFREKGPLLSELIDSCFRDGRGLTGIVTGRDMYVQQRREVTKAIKKAKGCCPGVLMGACGTV